MPVRTNKSALEVIAPIGDPPGASPVHPVRSPYQQFVDRWKDCTDCPLHETRQKIVLARGTLPCEVLLIGEAPGESENVVGVPFIGPAGRLLDLILSRSLPLLCTVCNKRQFRTPDGINCPDGHGNIAGREVRCAMTNLVCCIPRSEDGGKAEAPDDEAVQSCSTRLQHFVKIADPRMIVTVGALSRDYLDTRYKWSVRFEKAIPRIEIVHPASILRMNVVQQGLAVQRAVVVLKNALEDLFDKGG